MHRTTIYIPPAQLVKLERHRTRTGMSISEFIRRAIDAALRKTESKQ